MTTTVAATKGIPVVSTTTAACRQRPLKRVTSFLQRLAETYSGGNATSSGSSLSAVEEINFYLRRLTLGGTADVAQIDSFGGGPDYEMFLNAVQSVGTHLG
ncbi:hypothetical protein JTB14_023707 [Gonioctena quinquepunctata]|nr:hypothetical protein JTB14_023707 [Gonioctena quinquepunctata]